MRTSSLPVVQPLRALLVSSTVRGWLWSAFVAEIRLAFAANIRAVFAADI